MTVHLDSGTDVAVVEGQAEKQPHDPELLTRYERKYDRRYDLSDCGPLTVVVPQVVLAWRAAGWAGREGFQAVGRWESDP